MQFTVSRLRSVWNVTAPRFYTTNIDSLVIKSPFQAVQIPEVDLHSFLWAGMNSWSERIAFESWETGCKYTYNEAFKASGALAGAFRKQLGLQKGHTIAVSLPNSPEFCITLLAAFKAGLTVTTVNTLYTSEEVCSQLRDSDAKAVVGTAGSTHVLKGSQDAGISRKMFIATRLTPSEVEENVVDLQELCKAGKSEDVPENDSLRDDDVALLPYSSGTTGKPKGVKITARNLISVLSQINSPDITVIKETTQSHQEVIPALLPLFHAYGLVIVFLGSFTRGAKLYTTMKFTSDSFSRLLVTIKPHVLHVAPPVVHFMKNSEQVKTISANSLRSIMCGAAPLGPKDIEVFKKKFPKLDLIQGYGLTEASPLVTLQSQNKKIDDLGGCGWLIPNTECKIHEITGELMVRGPQIASGYHGVKSSMVDTEGWLHTGDVVEICSDGQLKVIERLKEMIKVKGFQVAPAELEAVLRQHKSVENVAVIGVPHDRLGEAPMAFIVPKTRNLTKNEINAFIENKVAPYKKLSGGIHFLEEIPVSPSGKILRRVLKKKYCQ